MKENVYFFFDFIYIGLEMREREAILAFVGNKNFFRKAAHIFGI